MKVNTKKIAFFLVVMVSASMAQAYQKVCRYESPLARMAAPFKNKTVTYSFSRPIKITRSMQQSRMIAPRGRTMCYVHLNPANKKIVLLNLRKYKRNMMISRVLSQLSGKKRGTSSWWQKMKTPVIRQTTQKVLMDFRRMGATRIGHVIDHLSGKKRFVPTVKAPSLDYTRPIAVPYTKPVPQVKPAFTKPVPQVKPAFTKPVPQVKPAFVK